MEGCWLAVGLGGWGFWVCLLGLVFGFLDFWVRLRGYVIDWLDVGWIRIDLDWGRF